MSRRWRRVWLWKRFCWCANENGGNDIVWSDDCSDAIGAFCRELNVEFGG